MFDEQDLGYLKEMEARIIEQSSINMRVILEGYVEPKFNLLADGHKLLLETLAPTTKVDELEEEVSFLKMVVQSMSREIAELKKAQ